MKAILLANAAINDEVRQIIRNYDLMCYQNGDNYRIMQHCKELVPYGEEVEIEGGRTV